MFHHPWMHGHRRGAMFGKGAVKFVVLDLISQKPRHGYDIIRELEESSSGWYSPSPGVVYPTLQMLEDLGYIAVKTDNGKKVYEITDQGREYLTSHQDRVKEHKERLLECFGPADSPEFISLMREMRRLVYLVRQTVRKGADAKKLAAIRETLAKAGADIEDIG